MAQRFHSINLQATQFPMLSSQQSMTVISTEAGRPSAGDQAPGIAYCHNVMPSKYGVDSVGFIDQIAAVESLPEGIRMEDVRVVFGTEGNRIYIAWTNIGNVYVLTSGSTTWLEVDPTVPATLNSKFTIDNVTIATVNGLSYIYYKKTGCFQYNETTNALEEVTLVGIQISATLGVIASSGYLIVYTQLAIAWSSTLVPTDFTPSQVTGAGGANVSNLEGKIVFGVSNSLGIILYTEANAVAGTYTGNVLFPFKFREIGDSKGGLTLDKVAYEANSVDHFVFTKGGLQTINSRIAQNILPEVTDFLAGGLVEDYSISTGEFSIEEVPATISMKKKIKYIASRYLVISYGVNTFTHALIYDTALQKLGKIKIVHRDVFEYIGDQKEVSKQSIAFMKNDGTVKTLDFQANQVGEGVLLLGKLRMSRTRLMTLLGVELQNVNDRTKSIPTVTSRFFLSAIGTQKVDGILAEGAEEVQDYNFLVTADYHSLLFTGDFNLNSVVVRYTIAGRE